MSFESLTKEVIREAVYAAVEDVGIDVAMKALCSSPPLTDAERILIENE